MPLIALTGVPGTGKTTIAQRLRSTLPVHEANQVARDVDAIAGYDEERDAQIVDEEQLRERARDELPDDTALVEGALAHHCDPDSVLLLRCHPDQLRERLSQRDWPREKIEENVMAETLDALVPEIHTPDAWEIDTTSKDPDEVAKLITAFLDGDDPEVLFDPLGSADWTDTLTGGAPA